MATRLNVINEALQRSGFQTFSPLALVAADNAEKEAMHRADYPRERAVSAQPDVSDQERKISEALLRQAKQHAKLHIELLGSVSYAPNGEGLYEALRYAKMSLMYLNAHLQDNE